MSTCRILRFWRVAPELRSVLGARSEFAFESRTLMAMTVGLVRQALTTRSVIDKIMGEEG